MVDRGPGPLTRDRVAAPEPPVSDGRLKEGPPMAGKPRAQSRNGTAAARRRTKAPKINEEAEKVLQKAQIYLLFEAKRPLLWTVADIREESGDDGERRWIIAVNLRYPTGIRGPTGRSPLRRDGARITELTDLDLMRERSRQIAAGPEGRRQWDELKAAALRSGQA